MILINGERKQSIDVADRGFQYGDGVFETIEILRGQPVFWRRHFQRLTLGCRKLGIPEPSQDVIQQEMTILAADTNKSVLKIIMTRGIGGRGYKTPEPMLPNRVLTLHAYPEYPTHYYDKGVHLRFCHTRLGLNPALAGIKHLNRLEQILARKEWIDADIQEGIMLDINDLVVEGTMTNIGYFKEHKFFTPSLNNAGVAGVLRSAIMDLLRYQQCPVIETKVTKTDLLNADELFVCNSIIGIWPVTSIADKIFAIGPQTRRLQTDLEDLKLKEMKYVN